MRILMTGATGLLGPEIGKKLVERGHQVSVISRSASKAKEKLPFPCEIIEGDLLQTSPRREALAHIEGVIHLMGEPVMGRRWTEEKKKQIYNSRILGTRHLVESLPSSLQVFVSASAIGYYGDCGDEVVTEERTVGADFLAKVCRDWEAEAQKAPGRTVCIRTGLVLSDQGGALQQMLPPFRAGLGGVLGSGQQWMSWIHRDDITQLFLTAIESERMQGAVNGVSPQPVTNRDFSQALASALGTSLGPAVPLAALRVLFGDAAEVVVSSLRGSSAKAEQAGLFFKFPDLSEALHNLCQPWREGQEEFKEEYYIESTPDKVELVLDAQETQHKGLTAQHVTEVLPLGSGTLVREKLHYPSTRWPWLAVLKSPLRKKEAEAFFVSRRRIFPKV
ncbi:MAG: TIGR01777 family oxidoreductase [Bdellovibrio sp.]